MEVRPQHTLYGVHHCCQGAVCALQLDADVARNSGRYPDHLLQEKYAFSGIHWKICGMYNKGCPPCQHFKEIN